MFHEVRSTFPVIHLVPGGGGTVRYSLKYSKTMLLTSRVETLLQSNAGDSPVFPRMGTFLTLSLPWVSKLSRGGPLQCVGNQPHHSFEESRAMSCFDTSSFDSVSGSKLVLGDTYLQTLLPDDHELIWCNSTPNPMVGPFWAQVGSSQTGGCCWMVSEGKPRGYQKHKRPSCRQASLGLQQTPGSDRLQANLFHFNAALNAFGRRRWVGPGSKFGSFEDRAPNKRIFVCARTSHMFHGFGKNQLTCSFQTRCHKRGDDGEKGNGDSLLM